MELILSELSACTGDIVMSPADAKMHKIGWTTNYGYEKSK